MTSEFQPIQDPRLNAAKKSVTMMLKQTKEGDLGAVFEESNREALSLLSKCDPAFYERTLIKLKKYNVRISKLEKYFNKGDNYNKENDVKKTLNIIKPLLELFSNSYGEPFASFYVGGHRETWPINSNEFSEWMAGVLYKQNGLTLSETQLKSVRTNLNSGAKFDGEKYETYLRTAKQGNSYYIDLGCSEWKAIKVTSDGWSIEDTPPVRFFRTGTMRSLPYPSDLGDITSLWNLINVDDHDQIFVLAFMLECFRPDTNYPVMELVGEQGSAKSTTQEFLREFIDPNRVSLRAAPSKESDIYIQAACNGLVSFNNMSHLTAKMQDAICNVSTGGGYASRKLYTNAEELVIDVKKPLIMNGICPIATAQDLLDRVIRLELPRITSFQLPTEMMVDFEQRKSTIMGGLLNLFVDALRIMQQQDQVDTTDRMADFLQLGQCILDAQGVSAVFADLYKKKKDLASMQALEASPSLVALIDYIEMMQEYRGSIGNLLEDIRISGDTTSEGWPKSPRGFSQLIRRHQQALRSVGIDIYFDPVRKSTGMNITVKKIQLNKPNEEW